MSLLREKVAIVTGGSRGIGRAIAERFIEEGARVVIASRSAPAGPLPAGLTWQACDVSRASDVTSLIGAVQSELRRVDILVNNAGLQIEKTLDETSDDDWDRLVATNMAGVFLCCRAVIPVMRAQGGGVIVNIGSISGRLADPGMALYNASKSFVHGLTRSIAVDHGIDGIRCNAVCPGWIMTEMASQAFAHAADPEAAERLALAKHPVGRFGRPEDVAALTAWLASDQAVFASGQLFTLDGGLTAQSPIDCLGA